MLLHKLQTKFADGVFGNFSPELAAHVISSDGLEGEERLSIYRNNVFSNFRGALRDSYPVIFRLLGEKFFNHAADEYVHSHPSASGDLHDFGGSFSGFLAKFAPCTDLPYLPDVARLEWAWDQAFHAADHAPLALKHALQRMAAVPPEHYAGLHFRLHPSCTLLVSDYPILRIWQVNQADYAGDQQVDLSEGSVRLALIRGSDFAVSILSLTAGEFAFLQAVADGGNLAMALESALESDSGFDLGTAIRHFINQEITVDFKLLSVT